MLTHACEACKRCLHEVLSGYEHCQGAACIGAEKTAQAMEALPWF